MTVSDLREWVRTRDDSEYVEVVMAPNPRMALRDLYGPLREARRERGPVIPQSQVELVGMGEWRSLPAFQGRAVFSALSYEACTQAFADAATFSSRFHNETIGHVWGHTILGMDDPEHRLYRGLISQAFSKRALAHWEHDLIEPIVNGVIDRFADHDRADLLTEFHILFPVYVISAILGIPDEDVGRYHSLAVETLAVFYDYERAVRASKSLADYLLPIIDQRRRQPGEDLISSLAAAELDGQQLSGEDIVSFVRTLLPAGGETTYRSSGSLMLALLTNPDQLAQVKAERVLLPQAIEEGLRWEAPLSSVTRIAVKDTVLAGVEIPDGSLVECAMGAANHDETRWPDPDAYDLHRPRQTNLAFAWGPHTCLGMHLARLETTIALGALFDRFPGLRLDPDADPAPEMRGYGLRSPTAVPVVLR